MSRHIVKDSLEYSIFFTNVDHYAQYRNSSILVDMHEMQFCREFLPPKHVHWVHGNATGSVAVIPSDFQSPAKFLEVLTCMACPVLKKVGVSVLYCAESLFNGLALTILHLPDLPVTDAGRYHIPHRDSVMARVEQHPQ